MPDDEELIKEMPPLMIDYSGADGERDLSQWRRKETKQLVERKTERKKKNKIKIKNKKKKEE